MDKKKEPIIIDFDNQPMAKEPAKGEVCRLNREALIQEQEIDLDNESNMEKEKEELEHVAFLIVKDGDGIDRGAWVSELIMSYPQEVVAVFGDDPFDAEGLLADMWDCDNYEDPESGVSMSWEEWSSFFSVYSSKTVYNALVELRNDYNSLKAESNRREE